MMDYEVFSNAVLGEKELRDFYNEKLEICLDRNIDPTRIEIEKLAKLEQVVHSFDVQIKLGLGYVFSKYVSEKYKMVTVSLLSFNIPCLLVKIEDLKKAFFFCETVPFENQNAAKNLSGRIITDIEEFDDREQWMFYLPYHEKPIFREESKTFYRTMRERHGGKIRYVTELANQITMQKAFKVVGLSDDYESYCDYLNKIKEEAANIISFKIIDAYGPGMIKELEVGIISQLQNIEIDELNAEQNRKIRALFTKRADVLINKQEDYYHSLITSEWLFNSLPIEKMDEKTSVVSGYIKAVEQLLVYILLKRAKGRSIIDIKGDTIQIGSENWERRVTLGNMVYFLKNQSNRDIYSDYTIKDKFIYKIQNWIKIDRNGFFHKDNLYLSEKTDVVRKHCLDLYILIIALLD